MILTQTELGLLVAVIAVSGVVVGGVIAGAFAVLTGWLDNRREHKRWLRQERYSVYVKVVAMLERVRHFALDARTAGDEISREQARELTTTAKTVTVELAELSPNLFIVGPRKVSVSFMRCVGALGRLAKVPGEAVDEYVLLRAQFIRDVQDVLRAGWTWERVTVADAYVFKEIAKEGAKVASRS